MAYSPRTKTNETPLDKKLHGVIGANGNVTDLPQYASWQWALKFTKAGVNDVDSYFELVSFIGGSAADTRSDVTEVNNNWPATVTEVGAREVSATQAIRHLGLGTNTDDDALAANLRTRGGYIQDYLSLGLDPVAVILPGYITVSDDDILYSGLTGFDADEYDLETIIKVGSDVTAGTYPVKCGLDGATAGDYGVCGYNRFYSVINEIWTPGYLEFGLVNAHSLLNLRSLTYLGASSFVANNYWGSSLASNYGYVLVSLYYNSEDLALKTSFNANITDFKTHNQILIDKPTGTTAPKLSKNYI